MMEINRMEYKTGDSYYCCLRKNINVERYACLFWRDQLSMDFIHHSVFYLGYTMLETVTCWQERTRQCDILQPETNSTICKFADSDRSTTHFAKPTVANMSLFTLTGAEVHLCLLCFPEASGKAPHPRLG
jgi:hypothetical protein